VLPYTAPPSPYFLLLSLFLIQRAIWAGSTVALSHHWSTFEENGFHRRIFVDINYAEGI
jgi:hypothetical protein